MRQVGRRLDTGVCEMLGVTTQRILDERGAGVFSENPARVCADQLGRNCFIHPVIDQHRLGVDAGLVCEDFGADDRLVLLQRNAAHALHEARQLAQLLILEAGQLDAVENAKRDDELVQLHVASPLAVAVGRYRYDLEAARNGRDRIDGPQAVVVVKMCDDR